MASSTGYILDALLIVLLSGLTGGCTRHEASIMSTAGGQTAEGGFVTAKLAARWEGWSEAIEWTDPATVKTTLELERDGQTSRFERVWRNASEGHAELQASLAPLRTRGGLGSGAIALVLGGGARPPVTHLWSPTSEPAELAAARAGIERAGHLAFARATLLFERGKASRAAGRDAGAIHDLSTGLKVLGDLYWSPAVIDDTDMKLVLAQHEEELGHLPVAATLYERVLESRLQIYEHFHPGSAG